MNDEFEIPAEVEAALLRQDQALALLERLRREEPFPHEKRRAGVGKREFRRWETPPGITVELYDGEGWHPLLTQDMGVGGIRVPDLPAWVVGPTPIRLKSPKVTVLALTDIMWREMETGGKAGLRLEFIDNEERNAWSEALIDALLAAQAVG